MNIVLEGVDELNKILKSIPARCNKAVNKALKKITEDLKGKAQRLAPVDLGDLRGSAFAEVNDLDGTVGFTEPYATRQHEEISYNHPKGGEPKYLEKPYKANRDKYIKAIGDAIKNEVEK
jgi:hypothetical protein